MPPSPPAEQATASQDQAGQACTSDGTGDRYRKSEIIEGLFLSVRKYILIVVVKSHVSRCEPITHEGCGRCGVAVHEGGIRVALYVDAEGEIARKLVERSVQFRSIY